MHYNKKAAASKLGFPERTFYRLLKLTDLTIAKGLISEDGLERIRKAINKVLDDRIKDKNEKDNAGEDDLPPSKKITQLSYVAFCF